MFLNYCGDCKSGIWKQVGRINFQNQNVFQITLTILFKNIFQVSEQCLKIFKKYFRNNRSKDNKDTKEPRSGAGTPTQDSNHGDMDLRLTNSTQSIQSVVSQQINNTDGRSSKRRCRDFDEKVRNECTHTR